MADTNREMWDVASDYFDSEYEVPVGIHYGTYMDDDVELFAEDLSGVDVVELGCGGGQGSIGFAQRGADVVGVDFSSEQVAKARERADEYGVDVDIRQDDVRSLDSLGDGEFDVAFSAWVVCWVENVDEMVSEAYRVLREGGRFVMAFPNPYFEVVNGEGELEKSYHKEAIEAEMGGLGAEGFIYYHKMETVLNALLDAGFRLEKILEPGVDDADAYEEFWHFSVDVLPYIPPTVIVDMVKPEG